MAMAAPQAHAKLESNLFGWKTRFLQKHCFSTKPSNLIGGRRFLPMSRSAQATEARSASECFEAAERRQWTFQGALSYLS